MTRRGGPPRIASMTSYALGLEDLGSGCYAYLQPDGSWGRSNRRGSWSARASRCWSTRCSTDAHARDAGGDAARRAGGGADRHAGEHPPQRRPLLRQRAGRGRGDHRLHAPRRRRCAASCRRCWHGAPRCRAPARRARGSTCCAASALRFRGHPAWCSRPSPSTRGLDRLVGGRWWSSLEVGPAAHRPATLVHVPRAGRCSPATSSSSTAIPSCWAGPVGNWIDACRADPRAGRRDRGARPRPRHRQGAACAPCCDYLAYVRDEADAALRRRDARFAAAARDIALADLWRAGATPSASSSTSPRIYRELSLDPTPPVSGRAFSARWRASRADSGWRAHRPWRSTCATTRLPRASCGAGRAERSRSGGDLT